MTIARFLAGPCMLRLILLGVFAAVDGQALAMETSTGFAAPDLEDYVMTEEGKGDGDGDGIDETQILRYRNLAGDALFSMTTKGYLWAWSREQHGGGNSLERNYVIRDSNCDGTFDERYSLDERFHVPDCLK